jgi:hypothetical protein
LPNPARTPTPGFEEELRSLRRYERDYDSAIGLPAIRALAHPVLHAARATLPGGTHAAYHAILSIDGVISAEDERLNALRDSSGLPPHCAEVVYYIAIELVRNVVEHASIPMGGAIIVSSVDNDTRVGIGVVDRGIGLRRSLARFHIVPDDQIAMRLAVSPGVTGTTSRLGGNDINAGAGLFFVGGLAALMGTRFLIVSGAAAWHLAVTDSPGLLTDGALLPLREIGWSGTAVAVDVPFVLPRSKKEMFQALNRAYSKQVKLARSEMYRRRSLMGDPT